MNRHNWIDDYMHRATCGEGDPLYHKWCGLAALSSIVSRRVWIDEGAYYLSMAIYLMLVGPAGNRKSSAIRLTGLMADMVGNVLKGADCTSKAALLDDMVKNKTSFVWRGKEVVYCPVTLLVDEFAQFLSMPDEHVMISFLTKNYDSEFHRERVRHGDFTDQTIQNPYIVLVGGAVPSWIAQRLKVDVLTGGISRRFMFVWAGNFEPNPTPVVPPAADAAWKRCVVRAQEIQKFMGPIELSHAARKRYNAWYTPHMKSKPSDPLYHGYANCKHVHLLKTAALMHMSDYDDMVINLESLERAFELLDQTEALFPLVFEGMGSNKLHQLGAQLTERLRVQGPLPETSVRRWMHREADVHQQDALFKHLAAIGQIEIKDAVVYLKS